jgi:hypothetical protein
MIDKPRSRCLVGRAVFLVGIVEQKRPTFFVSGAQSELTGIVSDSARFPGMADSVGEEFGELVLGQHFIDHRSV